MVSYSDRTSYLIDRVWLCYSTIIPLLNKEYWKKEEFLELLKKRPLERMHECCSKMDALDELKSLTKHYADFLTKSDGEASKCTDPNSEIWKELNNYAENFRNDIIKIINKTACENMRSYLLV